MVYYQSCHKITFYTEKFYYASSSKLITSEKVKLFYISGSTEFRNILIEIHMEILILRPPNWENIW